MSKLLAKFQASPDAAAAKAIVIYLRKHMMAECMADANEGALIAAARALHAKAEG